MPDTPKFRNGRDDQQNYGDCFYRGVLEPVPDATQVESAEEAAKSMYSDGYLQFPNILTSQEISDLRRWIDKLSTAAKVTANIASQLMIDLQHDPVWLTLIDRTPVFETLELILGNKFVCTGGSILNLGAGGEIPIHVDRLAIEMPEEYLIDERVRVPIFTCTVQYFLEDQLGDAGPNLVIPGSHRAGRVPHDESTWNRIAPKMVLLKAGGALLYRHDLWHGRANCQSERNQHIIQIHYGERSWKTAGAQIALADCFSPDVLARVTPRQRVLMGDASMGIFL